LPLRLLNGLLNHIRRNFEGNRKATNESVGPRKATSADFLNSPKALGYVFVATATDNLDRSQAKFAATTGNEGKDRKLVLRHEKSSISSS
jgi:hypothetical protein